MTACIQCGKNFGFFKAKKPSQKLIESSQKFGIAVQDGICAKCLENLCAQFERTQKDKIGKAKKIEEILAGSLFSTPFENVKNAICDYAQGQQMSIADIANAVKASMFRVAEVALEDGIVTDEEEQKVSALFTTYDFAWDDLDENTKMLLAKGRTIRDLIEGKVNPRCNASDMPFKLMKSEILVWIFPSTQLYAQKTVSKFVGGSQGFSFRIAKGVYWRVGGFKGGRVSHEEIQPLGLATVAITSRHLYFAVGLDSRRIKHDKIVSISPYQGGVVVIQDGARAKPLIFVPDDPWFFINVLQNANNWA